VSNEQVVEVDEFETANPSPCGEMTVTITLSDRAGGTDLLAVHGGLPHGPSLRRRSRPSRSANRLHASRRAFLPTAQIR
jgi:hypothetical protein